MQNRQKQVLYLRPRETFPHESPTLSYGCYPCCPTRINLFVFTEGQINATAWRETLHKQNSTASSSPISMSLISKCSTAPDKLIVDNTIKVLRESICPWPATTGTTSWCASITLERSAQSPMVIKTECPIRSRPATTLRERGGNSVSINFAVDQIVKSRCSSRRHRLSYTGWLVQDDPQSFLCQAVMLVFMGKVIVYVDVRCLLCKAAVVMS